MGNSFMSKKNKGRRYVVGNISEKKKYNYMTGETVVTINPFNRTGAGQRKMTAMEWVAKNQSEKYRRIKK